jgi:hypothetical protein
MLRLATAVAALAAALPVLAQDKVEVKLGMKKGLKYTRTTEIKGDGDCKMELGENGGITLATKAEIEVVTKMVEEVKDAKDGSPTDLKRQYPTRNSRWSLGFAGVQEQVHPLEGVALDFAAGAWKADGADKDAISKEKAADRLTAAIASGRQVAVGNTWDADKEKLKEWAESEFGGFAAKEAEMECKLGEFKDKDGQKCARIEINGKIKGAMKMGDKESGEMTLTVKGDLYYAIDLGLVTTIKCEGKLKADIEQGDQGQRLKLDLPLEWTSSVKVGEADFSAAKAPDKPKVKEKPEWYPPPIR